ncbi:hypothetical protein ABT160_04740 [Streptomyces sp. NPDC001941]|uniref:hypothetical protein n=1 Tax=Streptomyces sp. NPDC001941 TaxID=3154659 RepID=UPI003325E1C7
MTPLPAPSGPQHNKYKIGFTFKAAAGYEAEWITPTVYGMSADEVATAAVDLMKALADKGVIDLAAMAAQKVRSTHQAAGNQPAQTPATFRSAAAQTQAPAVAGDACPHGRTLREGQGAKGPWAALFCSAPKGSQCDPLWRQKDGSFS